MDTSALRVEQSKSFSAFTNEEAADAPAGGDRTAVLVVHGMGQQRKFETLSSVVDGIDRAAGVKSAVARNVRIGEERASRLELELNDGRRVDVYEAYWASITEGQVNLRDVMSFLRGAAYNGIKNARQPFKRWIFDEHGEPDVEAKPGRTTLTYLALAAAVLASLMFINALTLILGAANAMRVGPEWVKSAFVVEDLTATVLMLLAGIAGFIALYLCTANQKTTNARRHVRLSRWSLQYFKALCLLIVVVVVTMLLTLAHGHYAHVANDSASVPFMHGAVAAAGLLAHAAGVVTPLATVTLLGFAALFCAVGSSKRHGFGVCAALLLTGIAAAVIVLAASRASFGGGRSIFALVTPPNIAPFAIELAAFAAAKWLLVWGLLAAVSARVRKFLVQYVGDVAAYVGTTSVDRFDSIRERIKDCTFRTANAIYRAEENGAFAYGHVAVVGHSLGSVAAYDTLNRVLNEDAHANCALRATQRTTGLVTFGSPLDKTAFLFETNVSERTAARAALAATIQPMIAHRETLSIPWTNIYSPWDIISGDLNFYGQTPAQPPVNRVANVVDYDAVTPLGAHTEYWNNDLVWKKVNAILPAATAQPDVKLPIKSQAQPKTQAIQIPAGAREIRLTLT